MNRSYPRRSEVGGVWVERMQYRGWGEETRLGATASLQVNCAILSNGGSTIFQKRGVIEYDSIATVGENRVYRRADFQSGSRVLKKVF